MNAEATATVHHFVESLPTRLLGLSGLLGLLELIDRFNVKLRRNLLEVSLMMQEI